jgi:hypothetical protein
MFAFRLLREPAKPEDLHACWVCMHECRRFVFQAPKEAPMTALPKGQYVKHYRYGFGVVTESDDQGTSIEFELSGTKKFVTKLMVVELSDYTPPARFRAKWVKTASASPLLRKGATGKAAAARSSKR